MSRTVEIDGAITFHGVGFCTRMTAIRAIRTRFRRGKSRYMVCSGDLDTFTPIMADVRADSARGGQVLVVGTDGTLWTCGCNDYGQLGAGDKGNRSSIVQVLTDVSSISAGPCYSLALKADGNLWASGQNCYSQLGTGDTTDATAFVAVQEGVAAMYAGMFHTLALKSGGSFVACRSGYGDSYSEILTGVAIVSTTYHLLAVRQDGTL